MHTDWVKAFGCEGDDRPRPRNSTANYRYYYYYHANAGLAIIFQLTTRIKVSHLADFERLLTIGVLTGFYRPRRNDNKSKIQRVRQAETRGARERKRDLLLNKFEKS